MDLSLGLILFNSGFVLTCCILSLADHTKRGQVLFQLWK
jgi:hypothetical protein